MTGRETKIARVRRFVRRLRGRRTYADVIRAMPGLVYFSGDDPNWSSFGTAIWDRPLSAAEVRALYESVADTDKDPSGAEPYPPPLTDAPEAESNGNADPGPAPGPDPVAARFAAVDEPIPITRQQRRALKRAASAPTPDVGPPPLCRPGKHKLMPIEGTVEGKVVAKVVMCATCRRTFQEILDDDPEYAEMYAAWQAAGEPDDWPPPLAEVRS